MQCPCGSGQVFRECCEPYLLGASVPERAEQLMRSRYSAYVTGALDYLVATTHPKGRGRDLRAGYQASYEQIRWLGLEVLSSTQGGADDRSGKVTFRANYVQNGRHAVHCECSRFKRHGGRWHYLDGEVSDEALG